MKGLSALAVAVAAAALAGTAMAPVVTAVAEGWGGLQAAKTAAVAPKPEDLDRLLAPIDLYPDALLANARAVLHDCFQIEHCTIQVEREHSADHKDC